MKQSDYIIVGFGLAGAALALQLRKRGRSVMIYDDPKEHQASRVAAGLFNPVTGKLMQKTWQADVLFPYLFDFYKEAEEITGERFFYPTPICIPFLSIEEQNDWTVKSEEVYTKSKYEEFISDKFGGLILKQAGYLDTAKYLDAVKKLFTVESKFDYSDTSSTVIFCEGTEVSKNPYSIGCL